MKSHLDISADTPLENTQDSNSNIKPNIIIMLADDMGYGDMSCQGAVNFATPNLDAMAELGMRFTDMHSSSAVCTPSRYSVLTGRYCWRTRLKSFVLGGFGAPLIETDRPTIASFLKNQGYSTAAIGKWHLGLEWYKKNGEPLKDTNQDGWNVDGSGIDYSKGFTGGPCGLGFDHFYGISGSLDMPPYCYLKDDAPETIPTREKEHYYPQQRKGLCSPDFNEQEVDLTFLDKACSFIKCNSGKPQNPFFLYLAPSSPHRPCVPPDFLRGESKAGNRGDMVLMVDYMAGKIRQTLKECGQSDNTLLIFSSDNGARALNYDGKDYGHKSNGDWRGQKADIYEGGHREPFVAEWPGVIPAGSKSDQTLCLVDLFATIADITGQPLPSDAAPDSFSFMQVLKGGNSPDSLNSSNNSNPIRKTLIHHSLDGMFSVRKGPWKAVFGCGSGGFSQPVRYTPNPGEPSGQLYNVENDFRETTNLWSSHPEVVEELEAELKHCRENSRSRPV